MFSRRSPRSRTGPAGQFKDAALTGRREAHVGVGTVPCEGLHAGTRSAAPAQRHPLSGTWFGAFVVIIAPGLQDGHGPVQAIQTPPRLGEGSALGSPAVEPPSDRTWWRACDGCGSCDVSPGVAIQLGKPQELPAGGRWPAASIARMDSTCASRSRGPGVVTASAAPVLAAWQCAADGDEEAWCREWGALADRIRASAWPSSRPVCGRDALLRASNYYRTADFYRRSDPANDTEWRASPGCRGRLSLRPPNSLTCPHAGSRSPTRARRCPAACSADDFGTGAEPVPLGEHPDGLLDPDPCGQRVLELGHGHGQPGRLVGGRGAGQGAGVPRLRFRCRGSGGAHEVRSQQVREHHRARQVGGFLVADDLAPADLRTTVSPGTVVPLICRCFPWPLSWCRPALPGAWPERRGIHFVPPIWHEQIYRY